MENIELLKQKLEVDTSETLFGIINQPKEQCQPAGLFYRCGDCGQPTDKDGRPLDIEICKLLTDDNLNSAELVHGDCCPPQQDNYIIVTWDMAIDAGDFSLEGERWRW